MTNREGVDKRIAATGCTEVIGDICISLTDTVSLEEPDWPGPLVEHKRSSLPTGLGETEG